jgi:hypothetical protein
MKLLLITSIMLFSALTYAEPVRFICESDDEIDFLVLDENSAEFKNQTFINMTPFDEETDFRYYSSLNDPWVSLAITTSMLKEENGHLYLDQEDLETGEASLTAYGCFPAE